MKVTFPTYLLLLCLITLGYGCREREVIEDEVVIEKTIDPDAVPGLVHNVYVWLREDLTDEERRQFIDGMRSLETAPSVDRAIIGGPAATANRGVVDNSFDYAMSLWFDDVAAHDAYQTSAIHLKFVEDHEDKWTKVVVRDNEVL